MRRLLLGVTLGRVPRTHVSAHLSVSDGRDAAAPTNVIPLKSGIHASFRTLFW
jgi:hypothetical protein